MKEKYGKIDYLKDVTDSYTKLLAAAHPDMDESEQYSIGNYIKGLIDDAYKKGLEDGGNKT